MSGREVEAVVDETKLFRSGGRVVIWEVLTAVVDESGELEDDTIGGPGIAEEARSFIDRSLEEKCEE